MSKSSGKYAYVILCMRGDAYMPGVIALSQSIRMSGSRHDIVCMCTSDVSNTAREHISTVAKIYDIEYVKYESKPMKTDRQMALYGSWLDTAYTKWRCLQLTEYDKVILVDADIVVVQNIDHLFELQTPAGTFSTPWAKEYAHESAFDLRGYPRGHADKVPFEVIESTFERGNGYTMFASMVVLTPDKDEFQELCDMVAKMQPFGLDNWSTPDEQSLTYYYGVEKRRDWTHIHQRYNFIISKPRWLTNYNADKSISVTTPTVLHYFAEKKPWQAVVSFNTSPFPTDPVWWYILRQWWLATGRTLDIPRFEEMRNSKKITLRNTPLIQKMFPWIVALRVPFPDLF